MLALNELVSIVVPIYKVEKYLERCVISIINQTYSNLEIILVNDGSPDRCHEICEDFKMKDDRIVVIHKENGGLSEARNFGLETATGIFITFIDSDDWVHDEYIEQLYTAMKRTNSDITVCDFIKTSDEISQTKIELNVMHELSNLEALGQFVDKFYLRLVTACWKLYRRTLFEGIEFPVGKMHEDEFITYKLVYKAKKITIIESKLYYYWQREDSITGTDFKLSQRLDAIEAIKERSQFFHEINLEELSMKSYRILIGLLLDTQENLNRQETIERLDINDKFASTVQDVRSHFRKSKQPLKYKLFYELNFAFPKIMDFVYKNYKKIN